MARFQKKHEAMTETPVGRLILRLSIPATAALLLSSAYGFADAFFISRLGADAAGAVGVALAIVSLIQTVGFTLGNGAGSLLSRALGAKDRDTANGLAAIAFWLSILTGSAIALFGICFLTPIVRFLGATEEILPYARPYAFFLLCSAPVQCAAFALNNLLRAEGKPTWAMVGFAVGNLLNILLDPLLISRIGCGGASLATLLSQSVALAVLLSAYLFRRTVVSLSLRDAWNGLHAISQIVLTGLPSLFRQGLAGVAAILQTRSAAAFGSSAIAGMSAVSRIFLLLYSFCLGIGQGMMPAVGYNKGAKRQDRVLSLYRFSLLLASLAALAVSLPTALLSEKILSLFSDDSQMISIGASALQSLCAVLPLHGVIAVTNLHLQAVGNRFGATLIAAARQGLCYLPLILFLPRSVGLDGLIWSQAIADVFTFLLTLPFVSEVLQNPTQEKRRKRVSSAVT